MQSINSNQMGKAIAVLAITGDCEIVLIILVALMLFRDGFILNTPEDSLQFTFL